MGNNTETRTTISSRCHTKNCPLQAEHVVVAGDSQVGARVVAFCHIHFVQYQDLYLTAIRPIEKLDGSNNNKRLKPVKSKRT